MNDEELEFYMKEKPIVKCYINDVLRFALGKIGKDGGIQYFVPDENMKITVTYMSDEEWEEINAEDDDSIKS